MIYGLKYVINCKFDRSKRKEPIELLLFKIYII